MWLQLTSEGKMVMINGDRVLKIEEVQDGERRGCRLYYSATEFLAVDEILAQIMQRLGFEPRG